VTAGLTILRAYLSAGCPCPLDKIGSFEQWNLVREALVWVGLPDPATTREVILAEDVQKEVLVDLLKLWRKALGDRMVTLKEIETGAQSGSDPLVSELAAELASNTRFPNFNQKSVGRFLGKHVDRVAGGLILYAKTDRSSIKHYRVLEVGRQGGAPKPSTEIPF
jgi:hypothetical protein